MAGPAAGNEGGLRSRLAAMVESASDAIIGTTLDGIITSWNLGAMAVYGYTAEEVIGHPTSVLFPAGRADELVPILDQVRRGGRVAHYEAKHVRKDGTIIDVSVAVSPVGDESGAIAGTAVVARDVTEHNWAEAERRESDARLYQAERMETVVQLAGGIGREFNNLISAMMDGAARVAEATADNPVVQAGVQQMLAAGGCATWLARELLVFSHGDPTQPGRVDLNAVLTDARDLLTASVGGRVELRLITAPDLPFVLAGREQMRQVMLNLAENARDAMPHGGTLTFTTGLTDLSEVFDAEWPGTRPGQYVELTVSDTGCGMDAETMRHVFEPFFTTKPRGQATGLGLSTAYGIITKAGGGITIESEEGTGTTFHVYLPAIGVSAPASPDGASPGARGNAQTILVVDDEPAVLEITARILRHNGYRTLEASTCDEALSLMSTHDFQLLLTDTGMPCAPLADRALEMKPGIRVLRMSGPTSGMTEPGPVTSGEKPLIRKPFTAPDLLEKVRRVLATGPAE